MKKKTFLVTLLTTALVLSSVPVFGADDEFLEFTVVPVEETVEVPEQPSEAPEQMTEQVTEVVTDEAAPAESDLAIETEQSVEVSVPESMPEQEQPAEVPLIQEPYERAMVDEPVMVMEAFSVAALQRYRSEVTDTTIVEPLEMSITAATYDSATSDTIEAKAFYASSATYYSQYQYQCNSGYDIIAAYIQAEDGTYPSRMFFVYDKEYAEWLRYDYSETAAKTFLSKYEEKESSGNTLYVPVVKTSSGKNVLHSDNSKTAIDESKVPVINQADVSGINYAWKELAEFPFVKSGDSYVYAKVASTATPTPTPTPTPVTEDGKYTATIRNSEYVVEWTSSVQYDGRAHLWSETKVAKKNANKQVADINIKVARAGVELSPSLLSVTFKNNTNVTGFAGKNVRPYFTVALKGKANAKDSKILSKVKMKFDITPCPISEGKIQAKKVIVSGTKTSFSNPYFVFADGRKVAIKAKTKKVPGGAYQAAALEGGGIQFTGCNNLTGTGELNMDTPKKITYEW